MNKPDGRCESCGIEVPDYDLVLLSLRNRHQFHCSRCFNGIMAGAYGCEFEHPVFNPVSLTDLDGVSHDFHFRTLLFPTHVSIEALEMTGDGPGGYEFEVAGPHDEDICGLFDRLLEKMNKALSTRHLETDGAARWITSQGIVRGRIAWDERTDGRMPRLVIDGKSLRWKDFGRMVTAFKGSNFKFEIFGRSETR